jgi:hypothetical protein
VSQDKALSLTFPSLKNTAAKRARRAAIERFGRKCPSPHPQEMPAANGELLTFDVAEPQLLLETLSNALSERAKDAACIADPL